MIAVVERDTSGAADARDSDLVLAGHAHLVALGVPHSTDGPAEFVRLEDGPPAIFTVTETWMGDRLAPYWQQVALHCAGRTVALSWNGNQHNASFLIAPEPLFDFVCPGTDPADIHPGAIVVPAAVVRAYFAHTLSALPGLIRALKLSGARRVLILGSPAPKRDADFIHAHIRTEEYFQLAAAAAGIDLNTCRITPAAIRQKLWRLIQQMMEAVAGQEGVTFVPVPPETLEADGTLRREYWQDDSTHANRAFGARVRAVLDRIVLGPAS